MSHIVTSDLKLVDREKLQEAAKIQGFTIVGEGKHKMYGGQTAEGLAIKLPAWDYPVVVDAQGVAHYDNYNGSWGAQIELDKLCQRYAIEVAHYQAMLDGYMIQENILENGDIELEMEKLTTS